MAHLDESHPLAGLDHYTWATLKTVTWNSESKWPNDLEGQGEWPPFSIPAERIQRCIFGGNLVILAEIHYKLLTPIFNQEATMPLLTEQSRGITRPSKCQLHLNGGNIPRVASSKSQRLVNNKGKSHIRDRLQQATPVLWPTWFRVVRVGLKPLCTSEKYSMHHMALLSAIYIFPVAVSTIYGSFD